LITNDGYSDFTLLRDPLYGWVTNCPTHDPMASFYTPVVSAAAAATSDATSALGALALRPAIRESVDALAVDAAGLATHAQHVHTLLACAHFHAIYQRVHTAVCCDVSYAFTAQWSVRIMTSGVLLASLIASIAGYKRFRRKKDLWGPYASIESLEVGSYL
jgi:hypothetical protein